MKNRQFIILCILIIVGFICIWVQNHLNAKETNQWIEWTMWTNLDQYSIIVKNIDNLKQKLGN